jgi:uncharacterized protein (TIGR03067 family)
MPRRAALLLATAIILAGLPNAYCEAQEDAVKMEMKALAGMWRPVSAENNGFKVSEASLKDTRRYFDADGNWTMRRGDETVLEWKAKALDPTKTPKTIDIEVVSGSYKGVVYLGIYELDGDTLRICFAMPDRPVRPTEFTADAGSVRALSEFKRVKD